MIGKFWLYFLGTGLLVRILTPPLHFKKKTLTYYIREKTKKEIHHLHFGILFVITAFLLILIKGITNPLLFFVAFGLSLVADQIFVLKEIQKKYFTKKGLLFSLLGHFVIGSIMTVILLLLY